MPRAEILKKRTSVRRWDHNKRLAERVELTPFEHLYPCIPPSWAYRSVVGRTTSWNQDLRTGPKVPAPRAEILKKRTSVRRWNHCESLRITGKYWE